MYYTGREGFGRYHFQENIQFCRQSRGSICELIDDFNNCYDDGYIDETYCSELKSDGYTLIKVLNGYIASLKRLKKTYVGSNKVSDAWPM
jgi:four helix bundle protein